MPTYQLLDYIIIGQGLAGSALALKLRARNKRLLVIDQPEKNTSSLVAAGLFNPITGRKMSRTWMVDKLFPALHTHYRLAETLTGNTFFYPMPIYRPFTSVEEQNEWMGKSTAQEFLSYVSEVHTRPAFEGVKDEFGGLLLNQCGYLDTRRYIDSVRILLQRDAQFLNEHVSDNDLDVDTEGITYKNYRAEKAVFCNGTHSSDWFGWLPIKPLKGEAILIKHGPPQGVIINRGVYVVPTLSGQWRVGATYNYGDLHPGVTESSKRELTDRLLDLVKFPFTVDGQEWGFRPTTPDRRPILGRHPVASSVWTLNGLGTKGVSLAPYFADHLIDAMENGQPLNKEVDIERYKLLYWTSPR